MINFMHNDLNCLQSKGRETPNSRLFGHNYRWVILDNFWQKLVKIILVNSQEVEVRQKIDRYGNQYWYAYDPVTGKSFASGSEADISMWLEQLHRSH